MGNPFSDKRQPDSVVLKTKQFLKVQRMHLQIWFKELIVLTQEGKALKLQSSPQKNQA